MRPLAELTLALPLAGLAFDVDDTLTRDGVLEHEAFTAMHTLRGAGIPLIAVTGRPLGWAEVWARQWPVHIAIGENGAGWFWQEGGRAQEAYFADEKERKQIRATHERIRQRVTEELPGVRVASDMRLRRCDLAFDIGEEVQLDGELRDALEALIREEGATPISSSVHCHASLGGWDKALGIERAAREVLGEFDSARWIFIGDSGNDAAAFAAFEQSVGVANVREHALKTPPRFVTQEDRGRGFAELARHILELQAIPLPAGG